MTTVSLGSPQTFTLPAGQTLSIVAGALSTGRVFPFAERVGDTAGLTDVAESATTTLGPYSTVRRFQVECLSGSLAVTAAAVDFPTAAESLAAAATAAALLYVPVGASVTIGDVREYIGAGAPVDYTDGSPPATGEDEAGTGSRYTNATAGTLYINTGTKAQPAWTQLAPVA